jgi:hypothetical protein
MRRLFMLCAALCAVSVSHANETVNYAGDDDSWAGDTLRLKVGVPGFTVVRKDLPENSTATPVKHCAPAGSRAHVYEEKEGELLVQFDVVPEGASATAATLACPPELRARTDVSYSMRKSDLAAYRVMRTGLSFGALVIPFKYRLGDEKELVSSPAIAPFVGFRTAWLQSLGITFTPVAAAGLSLVPVPTADGKETENKAAYTVALGFRVSSSKNQKFTAGLLYGRDFLSTRETAGQPKLKKPWLSIYLGASL